MNETTVETSGTVGELFKALAAAQASLEGAKKAAVNPHLRSKYADLASVWEACRAALPANGLCVIQTTRANGKDGVLVVTTLGHASGEWIRGELYMPVSKPDAHGFGSALTYARRYALAAIVGVSPEDDDAAAAVATLTQQHGPIKAPPATAKQQQADALPVQLSASVSVLERAVDANQQIADAKTIAQLNDAAALITSLKREGLPASQVDRMRDLYKKRRDELQPGAA